MLPVTMRTPIVSIDTVVITDPDKSNDFRPTRSASIPPTTDMAMEEDVTAAPRMASCSSDCVMSKMM